MMTVYADRDHELADVAYGSESLEFEPIRDQWSPPDRNTFEDSKVAEIVHDFRNTLGAVSMLSELMLLELPADSPAWGMARDVRMACTDASTMCEEIMDSFRGSHTATQRLDLSALVDNSAPLLKTCLPPASELRYVLATDLPLLNLAAGEIRQLILNLVKNAAESLGDRPGTVTISTGFIGPDVVNLRGGNGYGLLPSRRQVYLAVSDTGCGIDKPTQARLQAGSCTTKPNGHGLGLASVRRIAAAHGAHLLFDSQVGAGTTVRVVFGDSA